MIFTVGADGWLDLADGLRVRAALGRGGIKPGADKREGDGASPAGTWPIRRLLYRPDKDGAPQTALPLEAIAPNDGWCDDPADPNYNRPVTLPYPASAEAMWRADAVYDLVLVLGHNDDPPVPGMGSAIFLHLARPDYAPTEGCVALARGDMQLLLQRAKPGDAVEILD